MWLFLALLTAFFTSFHDVFAKKIAQKIDATIIAWGALFFSLPFLYMYLWIEGVPPLGPPFGKALSVSTVILTIAAIAYFSAIKHSDLSIAMPMLAFTPLFLLVTSPLILGEFPGSSGLFGIILIVLGSYILRIQERRKGFFEPFKYLFRDKGPRYMLLVAFLYSIGANMDKIGVVHSSPAMWLTTLFTLVTAVLSAIILSRSNNVFRQIRSAWPFLVMLGMCHAVAAIFQMTAIKMTLVPYVVSVKRTSVVITSLCGFFLFKEEGMRERLAGAVLMVLGVFMISLFE